MKIVLFGLNASFSHSNLAIRRLRKAIDSGRHETVLFESNLREGDGEITEKLYTLHGDIYGFSCYIWNISRMLTIAKTLKEILPSSKFIFGGPEVSYDTERFSSCSFIDCIITGCGENVIGKVADGINDYTDSPQIIKGGDDILTEGILYGENEQYKTMYYESSVGCPFSCSYCLSSAESGVKAKSAETALREMEEFEKKDGDFVVKFIDRTFNCEIERANGIWRGMLEKGFRKRYQFEICASLLNEESFSLLGKFAPGTVQLEAGLQSTNEKTLKAVARHTDANKTLENCRRIKEEGNIHVHLDLIAGLPYEDMASMRKSFNDAYPCCNLLQLGFLKLLCGTALRRDAEKYGIKFMPSAPYTVLSTKWMSYGDIRRLEKISDLMERLRDSGHFPQTLDYGISLSDSPFDFYDGLRDFIEKRDGRSIRKISQNDVYRLLYEFIVSLTGADEETAERYIHEDYSLFENRNLKLRSRRAEDGKDY